MFGLLTVSTKTYFCFVLLSIFLIFIYVYILFCFFTSLHCIHSLVMWVKHVFISCYTAVAAADTAGFFSIVQRWFYSICEHTYIHAYINIHTYLLLQIHAPDVHMFCLSTLLQLWRFVLHWPKSPSLTNIFISMSMYTFEHILA